jgi:arylsulfatase A-like enzyme
VGPRLPTRLVISVAATVGIVAAVAVSVIVTVDRSEARSAGGAAPPVTMSRPRSRRRRRPSIVLILTDDQRWDTLWSMPAVRRLLVSHGVTFANAFVTNSDCCPSRSTILTGNYSHTTGIYVNRPPHGGAVDFRKYGDDRSTIATWLHDAGYHTGLVGKYLNGYHGRYIPPGWDTWDAFDWGFHYYGFKLYENDHPKACRGRRKCAVTYPRRVYSTNVLAGKAVKFIRRAPRSRPLFLYYAPFAPHLPATPEHRYRRAFGKLPPYHPANLNRVTASQPAWLRHSRDLGRKGLAFVHRFRRRQYETLISVDNAVRRIVGALRRTGRLHTTMIVFASDNGVEWGSHRFPAAVKRTPYDESIRIPLVVRYDPLTSAHRVDRHLILNTDWAPTWAALAHVPDPGTEGMSFLPLLHARHGHVRWRNGFLLEGWDRNPATVDPSYCGIRARHFMYTEYGDRSQELYDTRTDPGELHNLVSVPADHAELERLHAQMLRDCRPPPPGFHPR